jgi:hypothetical protein
MKFNRARAKGLPNRDFAMVYINDAKHFSASF